MATIDIPSLSAAAAVSGTDLVPITQGSSVAKKVTASALATFAVAQAGTTLAAHDNTTGLATTAFVQQERIGRNHARNGDFALWQAGTVFTGVVYGPDLWKQLTTAGRTYSRQAGFSGARYCFRWGRDNLQTGTTACPIGHVLTTESAIFLAGKQVVLSCDIRVGTNFSGALVTAAIVTGTGTDETLNISALSFPTGSSSSGSLTGSFLPTTVAVRHTFGPYTMPAGITEAGFRFNYTPVGTALAADYVEVTNVKLEEGAVATAFEADPLIVTLEYAQRRYRKSFLIATTPAQNAGAGTSEEQFIAGKAGATSMTVGRVRFVKPMLKAPVTVTLYNPEVANAQVRDQSASADCSAAATLNSTENGFTVTATGNASTAVGGRLAFHWVADARDF
jgi:hypothetical protein